MTTGSRRPGFVLDRRRLVNGHGGARSALGRRDQFGSKSLVRRLGDLEEGHDDVYD